jgi:hypothetical protein
MIAILLLVLLAWLGFVSFLVTCLAKVNTELERRLSALEASTAARPAPAPLAAR